MNNSTVSDDAIVIERVFDAPVDLIWQMWTDPEHFKKWYGPHGFSVPVAEMDLKLGGKHLICMEMKTPDRHMEMWTTGEYTEIVPNRRLVFTSSPSDAQGNITEMPEQGMVTTTVTVELEVVDGKTKMIMTHAGMPMGQEGAAGGWNQAFDKLSEYIQTV